MPASEKPTQKETCLHGFSAKNRSLKTASLRLRLAHDDSIADLKGHQVFTNLQRTVIGFARSRHEVINGCRWYRSAAEKDQPLRTLLSGRARATPRQYSYRALVRNRPMPQHPKLRSELKAKPCIESRRRVIRKHVQEWRLTACESSARQMQSQCGPQALATCVRRHADAAEFDIARDTEPLASHREQSAGRGPYTSVVAELRCSVAERAWFGYLRERQHVGGVSQIERHEATFCRMDAK
jgi:hypothetical protein